MYRAANSQKSLANELGQIGEVKVGEGERVEGTGSSSARRRWRQTGNAVPLVSVEDVSALGVAHVVRENRIARPFAGQLVAVGDAKRSALRLYK